MKKFRWPALRQSDRGRPPGAAAGRAFFFNLVFFESFLHLNSRRKDLWK